MSVNLRDSQSKIYVAGHRGMVGSAIVRNLTQLGCTQIITRTHAELDLTRQDAVEQFFASEKPEFIFLAAAKVGGIHANRSFPAEFLYQNMMMEANVIHSAHVHGTRKLLFLGSSCIYPRMAPQPIAEDALLTGSLEETNEAYALAKISGLKMCDYYRQQYGSDFISAMPTNLYGPADNYHPTHSHVVPALLRKFHEAKMQELPQVVVWGTGTPLREFLYVDDLAEALVFLMQTYAQAGHVNVGSGEEVSIGELARLVAATVGYTGELVFDTSMPDGTPRKIMDSSRLRTMGWAPQTALPAGLANAYQWALENSMLASEIIAEKK